MTHISLSAEATEYGDTQTISKPSLVSEFIILLTILL